MTRFSVHLKLNVQVIISDEKTGKVVLPVNSNDKVMEIAV